LSRTRSTCRSSYSSGQPSAALTSRRFDASSDIGRLTPIKRVDKLIEAVRKINHSGLSNRFVEVLVIGGGPREEHLRNLAADLPEIHFLGALPPNDQVARCLKISIACVVAGMVGLVANHALAHGRPVVTRALDTHSPELEYIEHERNGLIVPGDLDDFAAALARFADDHAWQARLAEGALATRDGLRMEDMAARFDEAVRITVARRQRRQSLVAQPEPRP
jgi:glycosyltransferase involved in cell wall biosynthesis